MSAWTDERTALLRKLWCEGMSDRLIAERLGGGLSRCAVIAKRDRLGLQRHKPTPPEAMPETRAPAPFRVSSNGVRVFPQPPSRPLGHLSIPPSDILSPNAKVWTERAFGECAFPVGGDGEGTVSCCNHTTGTYCDPHRRLMHDQRPRSTLKPGMAGNGRRRRDQVDELPGRAA